VIAPAQVRTIIQACQFGLILIARCGIVAHIPPASGASLILDLSGASDCPLITCVAVGRLLKLLLIMSHVSCVFLALVDIFLFHAQVFLYHVELLFECLVLLLSQIGSLTLYFELRARCIHC